MNKFNVGDRVKYSPTAYQDDVLEAGDLGTVVYYDEFNSVGVRWDKKDELYFHDCDGRCEKDNGYYVSKEDIEKIEEESDDEEKIQQLKNDIFKIVSALELYFLVDDSSKLFGEIIKLKKISSN